MLASFYLVALSISLQFCKIVQSQNPGFNPAQWECGLTEIFAYMRRFALLQNSSSKIDVYFPEGTFYSKIVKSLDLPLLASIAVEKIKTMFFYYGKIDIILVIDALTMNML